MNKKYTLNPDCENCQTLDAILKQKSEVEETLHCAVKMTKLGVWDWNLITNKVTLSNEVFEIAGYDPNQFEGTFDFIFTTIIHSESQALFRSNIEIAINKGIVPQDEYRISNPSKEECWVRINGEIIYDDRGEKIKLIGTVLDVTDDYLTKSHLSDDLSFFASLVNALPNPIFYKDNLGLYKFCNTAFTEYIGVDKDAVINKSVFEVSPEPYATVYHKADLELMAQKGHQVYEAKAQYADGTFHDVIFSKAAHLDEKGNPIGLVGIMQDITEKKTIEKKESILKNIRDIFWRMNQVIMEIENEVDFFNIILKSLPAVLPHIDKSVVLIINDSKNLSILTSMGYVEAEEALLDHKQKMLFLQKDNRVGLSKPYIINDILNATIQSSLIIPIYIDDQLKWLISIDSNKNNVFDQFDLAATRFIQEELPIFYRIFDLTRTTLRLSRYDSLTDLMNRGYFDTVFTEKLSAAELSKVPMTLIIFDLDDLKMINDNFGHHSGDLYLKSFSELLTTHFQTAEILARLGGDEFACLISSADINPIITQIEEIRTLFEDIQFDADEYSFRGSFSYGLASFPIDSISKEELMKLADKRMYLDKDRLAHLLNKHK